MIGKEGNENSFQRLFSNRFNIHKTRQNFPNEGIDNFENMALKGVMVTDKVIKHDVDGKNKYKCLDYSITILKQHLQKVIKILLYKLF